MKVAQKLASWLAASALLLALAVAASFWAFGQLEDSVQARASGFVEIRSAHELLVQLSDAETGQRGYVLTGDATYLQPYLKVRGDIRALVGGALLHHDSVAD